MNIKKNILRNLLPALLFVITMPISGIAQTTPDPGLPGTLAVTKAEYNFGDLAFLCPSFPDSVEVRGSVHYPTGLAGSDYPVLLFLHGRHETCYDTTNPSNTSGVWPCPSGWSSITSYEGYDYLANQMASHGYIVISISANAINATDNSVGDYGMQGRGELMQHHLDLWNGWNTTDTTGPFGSLFVGKLNMQNIGTMGHSRGGEGAVFNALYNRSLGSPYGIKAVLTLAPVDFERHVLNGIPLLDVAPYCDGDVSDIQGVHFYDDARYSDTTDESPKHTVLFMGANHNFFNTVWTPGSYIAGGADDWDDYIDPLDSYCGFDTSSNKRFDTTKQKAALTAYLSAFYRVYIGHEDQFGPILNVNDLVPPASSMLDSSEVFVSYHPGHTDRLDVNRTDSTVRTHTNTLADTVIETGLLTSTICGGGLGMASCGITSYGDQKPHEGSGGVLGLAQMHMRWNDTTEWYQNSIPGTYENLSQYKYLQFRASVDFRETTTGQNLDLTVEVIDSAGDTSRQVVSNHSHALFYQPGTEPQELPKVILNTIQIPLSSFTGINIAKVRNIRFKFNQVDAGAMVMSDLAVITGPCGTLKADFTDTLSGWYRVNFTDKSTSSKGDSVVRLWNFGNTASGTADTSTAANPFHVYPAIGTYHVCLYVTTYRKNSYICTDSFCTSVILPSHVGVPIVNEQNITIVPNPAKDHIRITGAAPTDVLTLVDLYGRTVLTTTITSPDVLLPQDLATGIYYAVVTTSHGKVYQKLLISK